MDVQNRHPRDFLRDMAEDGCGSVPAIFAFWQIGGYVGRVSVPAVSGFGLYRGYGGTRYN